MVRLFKSLNLSRHYHESNTQCEAEIEKQVVIERETNSRTEMAQP
jgi:hypothetical protein